MPGNKQTEVTLQMLKDELSFNSVFQANMPPVFVMTYRSQPDAWNEQGPWSKTDLHPSPGSASYEIRILSQVNLGK